MPHHDRPPSAPASADFWAVWRTDDNGNTFVVREHLSRSEAKAIADEFEARGHKQIYWIEPERDNEHNPHAKRASDRAGE